MLMSILEFVLLISTCIQCYGLMWNSSWDSSLLPDFSQSPGVDEFAVPSVIVAGKCDTINNFISNLLNDSILPVRNP